MPSYTHRSATDVSTESISNSTVTANEETTSLEVGREELETESTGVEETPTLDAFSSDEQGTDVSVFSPAIQFSFAVVLNPATDVDAAQNALTELVGPAHEQGERNAASFEDPIQHDYLMGSVLTNLITSMETREQPNIVFLDVVAQGGPLFIHYLREELQALALSDDRFVAFQDGETRELISLEAYRAMQEDSLAPSMMDLSSMSNGELYAALSSAVMSLEPGAVLDVKANADFFIWCNDIGISLDEIQTAHPYTAEINASEATVAFSMASHESSDEVSPTSTTESEGGSTTDTEGTATEAESTNSAGDFLDLIGRDVSDAEEKILDILSAESPPEKVRVKLDMAAHEYFESSFDADLWAEVGYTLTVKVDDTGDLYEFQFTGVVNSWF